MTIPAIHDIDAIDSRLAEREHDRWRGNPACLCRIEGPDGGRFINSAGCALHHEPAPAPPQACLSFLRPDFGPAMRPVGVRHESLADRLGELGVRVGGSR